MRGLDRVRPTRMKSLNFPHFNLHATTSFSNRRAMERSCSIMKNKWLVISLMLVFFAFSSLSAPAQETTGGLQGTVKDSSGAVVPHVKVVVSSDALGASKELETDASGYYRFANFRPVT